MMIEQKVKQNKSLCGFCLKLEVKNGADLFQTRTPNYLKNDALALAHSFARTHARDHHQKPAFKECYVSVIGSIYFFLFMSSLALWFAIN